MTEIKVSELTYTPPAAAPSILLPRKTCLQDWKCFGGKLSKNTALNGRVHGQVKGERKKRRNRERERKKKIEKEIERERERERKREREGVFFASIAGHFMGKSTWKYHIYEVLIILMTTNETHS